MYSRDELFMRTLEYYFGVYLPRFFATREINTKIALSWALNSSPVEYIHYSMIKETVLMNTRSLALCKKKADDESVHVGRWLHKD